MEGQSAKGAVMLSTQRPAISSGSSSSFWLSLVAFICVLLYVSAYVFAGQRSIGVSRSALVVIPREVDRGQFKGGAAEGESDSVRERGKAERIQGKVDGVDTADVVEVPAKERSPPVSVATGDTGDKEQDDYAEYAYEDDLAGEEDDYEDGNHTNDDEDDYDTDDGSSSNSKPNTVNLKMRTEDDRTFWENRRLDPDLNPHVTSEVQLRKGWKDTAFDQLVASRLEENKFYLHQTWKTDCVLKTRVQYMKTWLEVEPDLRVIFWTDDEMDLWVKERFEGTDVHAAWERLEQTRQAKIKKADMFRAMAMWYYGGVYADLDIELKSPVLPFIENEQTLIVWEPEHAMEVTYAEALGGHYEKRRGARKTLMLSAFVVSGRRYADFLGFYINWIVANTLSGRSGEWTHVLDHTGPIAEAEAYYYYTGRLGQHDPLLKVYSYEEFQNYGEHYTVPGESTWDDGKDGGDCVNVRDIYHDRVDVV